MMITDRKSRYLKRTGAFIGMFLGCGAILGLMAALNVLAASSLFKPHASTLAGKLALCSGLVLGEVLCVWAVIAFVYYVILNRGHWRW